MTTDIETQIRKAYRKLTKGQPTYVPVKLADLRNSVAATTRQMDKALTEMAGKPGIHLRSEADQKTLTGWDHFHSLTLGGVPRHTLLIEG